MDTAPLGFALAAGLAVAVNPCGYAMLPGYLALVAADAGESHGTLPALRRALTATAAMVLGFFVVFEVFVLAIEPRTGALPRYLPIATVVIGGMLVLLGLWMLIGRGFVLPHPKTRLISMLGFGACYAIASLSTAAGPFLALTSITFRDGAIVGGVLGYLGYMAGLALVVGVPGVVVALLVRARAVARWVRWFGGALLVLGGLFVGYYGFYEGRLFIGDGVLGDQLIDASAEVQHRLAAWVERIGALPLAAALVVLVLGAVLFGKRRAQHAK
ncbi:MAG: cytochrome c biogenesis protein CcdA [Pseudonocardiaceae bacterium]|nr:cytochrome c biogenesis protein CcdA [Pseudonocardiaceae bacterium]